MGQKDTFSAAARPGEDDEKPAEAGDGQQKPVVNIICPKQFHEKIYYMRSQSSSNLTY